MPFRRSSRKPNEAASQPPAELAPPLGIEEVTPFLRTHLGLPHINWNEAVDHIESTTKDETDADDLAYAMVGGWVDALAEALHAKHKVPLERWRNHGVEGMAPAADRARLERATTSTLATIGRALAPIRGEPDEHPIPHITIIAAPTLDAYYDFYDAYHQDDGDFATSGGAYLGTSPINPASLIINFYRYALEHTLAHELTHHALAPVSEEAGYLPRWIEEGFAMMMEERVTTHSSFVCGGTHMQRHRALWSAIGLAGFLNGDTFGSPEEGQQELSYNLAEAVTRSLLATRPKAAFAFARACLRGEEPTGAAIEHLGQTEEAIVERFLNIDLHK